MNDEQQQWILNTAAQAKASSHIFPEMAACEAALESKYGASVLGAQDNNLFGMKQHKHPIYGDAILPTREFEDGEWKVVDADWIKYPDLKSCFEDRMNTLRNLAPYYPHYESAICAPDATIYVREVSQTWSTDPNRASKVLAIYSEAFLGPAMGVTSDIAE